MSSACTRESFDVHNQKQGFMWVGSPSVVASVFPRLQKRCGHYGTVEVRIMRYDHIVINMYIHVLLGMYVARYARTLYILYIERAALGVTWIRRGASLQSVLDTWSYTLHVFRPPSILQLQNHHNMAKLF